MANVDGSFSSLGDVSLPVLLNGGIVSIEEGSAVAPSEKDLGVKQPTINPATYEELKYQSLVTFSGNTFPPHFYQWRKEVLNLNQGIPLASQAVDHVFLH